MDNLLLTTYAIAFYSRMYSLIQIYLGPLLRVEISLTGIRIGAWIRERDLVYRPF